MRIVFIEDLSGGTFSSLILTRCWWYRDSKHEIPQFVGQCTVQCAVCVNPVNAFKWIMNINVYELQVLCEL